MNELKLTDDECSELFVLLDYHLENLDDEDDRLESTQSIMNKLKKLF